MPNRPDLAFDPEDDDEPVEQFDGPYSPWPRQVNSQGICPQCNSAKVEALHTARRVGGTVGTTAGAAGAFAAAMAGVEGGATVGASAGTPCSRAVY